MYHAIVLLEERVIVIEGLARMYMRHALVILTCCFVFTHVWMFTISNMMNQICLTFVFVGASDKLVISRAMVISL